MSYFQGNLTVTVSAADSHVGHSIALHLAQHYRYKLRELRVLVHPSHEERVTDLVNYQATVYKIDTTTTTTVVETSVFERCDRFIFVPSVHLHRTHEARLLLDAAKRAAVRSVLFISHLGAEAAHKSMQEFRDIEAHVKEWENHVIFRTHWFIQNIRLWASQIKEKFELALPLPSNHRFSPLDINDLCRCTSTIVTIQSEEELRVHYKKVYTLTGPEIISTTELTERLTVAVGVKINYREVAREETERFIHSLKDDAEYIKFHAEHAAESFKLAVERKEESIKETVEKTVVDIGARIRHLFPTFSSATETDVTIKTSLDFFEWSRTSTESEVVSQDCYSITGRQSERVDVFFSEHKSEFVSIRG